MAEEAIIKSVKNYLNYLKDNGFNVSFGVLYGSRATGTATEFSDIDLIVVSPDFDKNVKCRTIDKLWQLAGRTDYRIEPIPCGLERWEKDDYTPIIDIARNEGTIVTLN
jgi:predicted nucleotidyltransferase